MIRGHHTGNTGAGCASAIGQAPSELVEVDLTSLEVNLVHQWVLDLSTATQRNDSPSNVQAAVRRRASDRVLNGELDLTCRRRQVQARRSASAVPQRKDPSPRHGLNVADSQLLHLDTRALHLVQVATDVDAPPRRDFSRGDGQVGGRPRDRGRPLNNNLRAHQRGPVGSLQQQGVVRRASADAEKLAGGQMLPNVGDARS